MFKWHEKDKKKMLMRMVEHVFTSAKSTETNE